MKPTLFVLAAGMGSRSKIKTYETNIICIGSRYGKSLRRP